MTLLSALASPGARARATTLERLSPPQQIARAEAIFVGTVVDVVVRSSAQANVPYTFVTFSVADVLKGDVPAHATIRLLGGSNEDGTLAVIGMPRLAAGQTYLMFVAENGRSECPVVGWAAGALAVVAGGAGRTRTVRDESGRALRGFDEAAWQTADAPDGSATGTLDDRAPAPVWLEDRDGATTAPPAGRSSAQGAPVAAESIFAAIRAEVARQPRARDASPHATFAFADLVGLDDATAVVVPAERSRP